MGMNPKEFVSRSIDIAKNSEVSDPLEHLEPSARIALRDMILQSARLVDRAYKIWSSDKLIDPRDIIVTAGYILSEAALFARAFSIPFEELLDEVSDYSGSTKVHRLDATGTHITEDVYSNIVGVVATIGELQHAAGVAYKRSADSDNPRGNINLTILLRNLIWHLKEALAGINSSLEEAVDMSMEIIERQAANDSGKTSEQAGVDADETEEDADWSIGTSDDDDDPEEGWEPEEPEE